MKLIIIQKYLPHYRIPFFDEIVRLSNNCARIYYTESDDSLIQFKSAYRKIKCNSLFGFDIQSIGFDEIDSSDIVVAEFDVHRVLNFIFPKFTSTKVCYWGIGLGGSVIANKIKKIYANKNGLICYSDAGKSALEAYGIENVKVAHNTIKVERENELVIRKLNGKPKDLLFVGSLNERKGLLEFLSVYADLVNDNDVDIGDFNIVGDGPLKKKIKSQIRYLGLDDRVKLYGFLSSHEDLLPIFQKSVLNISPNQAGLSVLQSLAYATPFVTNKNAISGGEIENVIPMVTGNLFTDIYKEFIPWFRELMNNDNLRDEMISSSYDYYWENRTVENYAAEFYSACRDFIDENHSN